MGETVITFEQGRRILDENPAAVLLDVREADEFEISHASEATLLSLSVLSEETALETLPDRDVPVIVYCRSGRRSAQAARMLRTIGYTRVYDMGGLIGWPYGMDTGDGF